MSLPDCPKHMAHPQSVWFEEHWRPKYDALLAERDALRAELDEIKSYLPKIPTQPYEKEMAQKIVDLQAEVVMLRASVDQYARNEDALLNKVAALKASLRDCVGALELISDDKMDPRGVAYGAIEIAKKTLTAIRSRHKLDDR